LDSKDILFVIFGLTEFKILILQVYIFYVYFYFKLKLDGHVACPDSLIPLLLSELMWIIGSGSDITDEAALASAWLGLGSGSAWLKYGSGLGEFGSKIDLL
jgi:hypothetical protein